VDQVLVATRIMEEGGQAKNHMLFMYVQFNQYYSKHNYNRETHDCGMQT